VELYKFGKYKLLYSRTEEYEPCRLCLPDIPYRKKVIQDNQDLAIIEHSEVALHLYRECHVFSIHPIYLPLDV
jgi:hypothetical protein